MAEEHLTTGPEENKPQAPPTEAITPSISAEDRVESKWVNSQNQITNWVEWAKEQGWISQAPPQFGPKAKKYLPAVFFGDLGNHPAATAFYTDDCPLEEGDSSRLAVLIDKVGAGQCWVRMVRIEGDQIFVTSPLWPRLEAPFPLNYFQSIERVFIIDYQK